MPTMPTTRSMVQIAVLIVVLTACLHFVYSNGLVPKDTITILITGIAAAAIRYLDKSRISDS